MTDIEETKVKESKPIGFRPVALTRYEAYMMSVSGTYIKTGELGKVMNQQ